MSDEIDKDNTTDYFDAGSINVDEQIKANGFDDLKNLNSSVWVNPFLQFPLDNLNFASPKIQSSPIFFSEFG